VVVQPRRAGDNSISDQLTCDESNVRYRSKYASQSNRADLRSISRRNNDVRPQNLSLKSAICNQSIESISQRYHTNPPNNSPTKSTGNDLAKNCMKVSPAETTTQMPKVFFLPQKSIGYDAQKAPKTCPIGLPIDRPVCQGAEMIHSPLYWYPKSR
jgi:hypothetical protein